MLRSIDRVFVNLGVKRLLYLPRRPRKFDQDAAPRRARHLKPVRFQPGCDRLDVLRRRAELRPELLRRQPFVIVRRRIVLLLLQQLPQSRFLVWASLQNQQHSLHRQACRRRALVELGSGQRMRISVQRNQARLIERQRDPRRNLRRLRACFYGASQNQKHSNAQTRKGWEFPCHGASVGALAPGFHCSAKTPDWRRSRFRLSHSTIKSTFSSASNMDVNAAFVNTDFRSMQVACESPPP